MKQVSNEIADSLEKKLNTIWDIENYYWYPIYDCTREDVIAFNSNYIENAVNKISDIQNFLLELNINQIFEMHEDRTVYVIETNTLNPSYGRYGEKFWFNEDMGWIIYASHEGSITFGGRELISSLKRKWRDWESNLFPYNKR